MLIIKGDGKMNEAYRARYLRSLPNPFLCAKCGNEIKEVIFSSDDLLCPFCESCLEKLPPIAEPPGSISQNRGAPPARISDQPHK